MIGLKSYQDIKTPEELEEEMEEENLYESLLSEFDKCGAEVLEQYI